MQAMITWTPMEVNNKVIRPLFPGGNNSTTVYAVDESSERLAEFLIRCGVECSYEVRDGSPYPWLWIFDAPTLVYYSSNNSIFMFNPSTTSTSLALSLGGNSANTRAIFSGNPKSSFILRFEGTDGTIISTIFMSRVISPSGNRYRVISKLGTSKYVFYQDDQGWHDYAPSTSLTPSSIEQMDFLSHDADGRVPLIPQEICHMPIDSTFMYPKGFDLPTGLGGDSYWLEEIVLGGHRYLNASGVLNGFGLIQLDDDDPEVTEEDLIGGLES